MLGDVLGRRGPEYSQVCDSTESIREDTLAESTAQGSRGSSISRVMSLAALFTLGVAVGMLGTRAVYQTKTSTLGCSTGELPIHGDFVPQVRISSCAPQLVRHYPEFEAPPPAEEETEEVWDSLIPSTATALLDYNCILTDRKDGVGYVIHPDMSPNMSVLGVFHELHCLLLQQYLIRRAYYANNTVDESFDVGIERHPHIGHCFDYLRQSILCAADSHLEPTTERVIGNDRWGFQRQCRNYTEIKEWAAQWKVFDIEGSFVPSFLQHNH
ncbi:hypothetical protein APSETT445_009520 [Aspergillus pseudonomiae]